jgi:hypothetical protein
MKERWSFLRQMLANNGKVNLLFILFLFSPISKNVANLLWDLALAKTLLSEIFGSIFAFFLEDIALQNCCFISLNHVSGPINDCTLLLFFLLLFLPLFFLNDKLPFETLSKYFFLSPVLLDLTLIEGFILDLHSTTNPPLSLGVLLLIGGLLLFIILPPVTHLFSFTF